MNIIRNTRSLPVWQRNYYEHIIRNEESYIRISEYTRNNPSNWKENEFNREINRIMGDADDKQAGMKKNID
ncbi:MAG TPA: hypothetical protein PL048_16580 [Leptospiraceae bacterium]|nr:hypothetical protein [Leptospiraceae bacterium]HMY65558.1 hypothetical protein [Leptospiraceae bacterium]HMZ60396.1 hypothetical protein [Leptospiraceae bacterium]HNF14406.1 hypothetical protein [Leptospiraceae bacterium]HNF25013.1 hypothetical protein [Leptospiraceae bacterium]